MANANQRTKPACLATAVNPPGGGRVRRRRLLWSSSRIAVGVWIGLSLSQAAHAQIPVVETIDYTYDALGRLKQAAHSGTVNSGVTAAYTFDAAGNRSNVTVTTSAPPAPSFAIGPAQITEGGTLSFPVTRSGTATGAYTMSYSTANGTAVAPTNYGAVTNGTVSFASGQTNASAPVTTVDDSGVNTARNMSVTIFGASGGATITTATATGTIDDNDTAAAPSFAITDAPAVTEGGMLSFTVNRTGTSTGSYTVQYQTSDGTAQAPGDYTAKSLTTLTFASGVTQQTIQVQTNDDTVVESGAAETVNVSLSGASGGATITRVTGVGTINDNDTAAPSFAITDATSVTEGGLLNFTVNRSTGTGTYTVQYQTSNGTAQAPGDYNAKSLTTLTFAPGVMSQPIQVQTIDDTVLEPGAAETVNVSLSGASGGATITRVTGTGAINDNDSNVVINLNSGGSTNLLSEANSRGYTATSGVTYNFVVPSGTTITGSAGGGTAISTGSWPGGVNLTLSIAGTVQGGGGRGGDGGYGMYPMGARGVAGGNGGDAISCGAPINISVTGALRGGGGGGGAAGAFDGGGSATGGGGGGGGAPFGPGGTGGSGSQSGGNGETATASFPGQGGFSPLSASGGPGGAGGGFGAAGASGGANQGQAAATGGAAGYAVRVNGSGCTANGNITGTVG